MCQPRGTLISLFSTGITLTADGLIIEHFQLFVDEIPLPVLPLGVHVVDGFHEYSRTVLVVEIVLLECTHLALKLMS